MTNMICLLINSALSRWLDWRFPKLPLNLHAPIFYSSLKELCPNGTKKPSLRLKWKEMFPDRIQAVLITNSSFTVGHLTEAVNCLFAFSSLQVQPGQEASKRELPTKVSGIWSLPLLAWLGDLFQTANSPSISASEMSICWFIWMYYSEISRTIPKAIWICHQYQTHREIKKIGKVCLQIYKVMAYLKIWIEFEVLDSPKHMSCWVAILLQLWAPEMMSPRDTYQTVTGH